MKRWRGFNEDLLSAYVDGELDARERADVERELTRSPHLRTMVDQIEHARSLVRGLPERDLDAEGWRRIHWAVGSADARAASGRAPAPAVRLARRATSTRAGRFTVAFGIAAAAAAVLVVVAVAVPAQRVNPDVASLARASAIAGPGSGGTASDRSSELSPEATGRSQAEPPQPEAATTAPGKWRYLGERSAPDDAVQLRYRNRVDSISVFVQEGAIDWDSIPHGRGATVAGHRARIVDASAAVYAVVWEDGGSVFASVGEVPEDTLLRFARAFASGRIEGRDDDGLTVFLFGPFSWS